MRAITRVITLVLFSFLVFSCAKKEAPELTVYTYDSFASEWGAGPRLAPLFEKETGIKLRFVPKGDGGQLLATLIQEKGRPEADLVLGLDNQLAPKALEAGILEPYAVKAAGGFPDWLKVDASNRLTAFDYGQFAFIWDTKKLAEPPKSLEDLTKGAYTKKIIIMDPRTSTPGLGFLAWTKLVYGEGWKDYWKRLAPNVLAMTPGWDTGYGLFTAGEAPLVLSYATSPAYHLENEGSDRYRALEFAEGHPVQVELAGVVKGAPHRKNAERFMDFLLSPEAQAELPLTQYMYPAVEAVSLPASYSIALKPAKTLAIDPEGLTEDAKAVAAILQAR